MCPTNSWPERCWEQECVWGGDQGRGGEEEGGGEEGKAKALQVSWENTTSPIIDPNCFHDLELNLVSPVARQDVSEPKSPQIVVNKIDEALR